MHQADPVQMTVPPALPNGEIPTVEIKPLTGETTVVMMQGVSRMIAPTIMQAGKGGYITVIPGIGVYASSTMDECITFIEKCAEAHFTGSDLPKFAGRAMTSVRNKVTGVKERIIGAAQKVDYVLAVGLILALSMSWLATTGATNETTAARSGNQAGTKGLSIPGHRAGSGHPRESGETVLPKVYVRALSTTSDDGPTQLLIQEGNMQPVRAYD